jgi:hypothetical protein
VVPGTYSAGTYSARSARSLSARRQRGGAKDLFSEVNAQLVGKAMTWPEETIDGLCNEDCFQQHLRRPYSRIVPSLSAKPSSSSARGRIVTPLQDVWRRSGRLRLDAKRVGAGGLCLPEPERGKVWKPS